MDKNRRIFEIGAGVILGALVLRLGIGGFFDPMLKLLHSEDLYSIMLYLETGRIVRFSPSLEEPENFAGESPPPSASVQKALPVFSEADAAGVQVWNNAGIQPDIRTLLTRELNWDLTGDAPTVLILHTHTTESYTKSGENYQETSAFRTLDEQYNMLSVGDRVAQVLTDAGITVIHDRQLHDYPSYNGSYTDARRSISEILRENPSIRLVLDLHRDASGDLNNQFRPVTQVNGQSCAQLMLVMGTNASGQYHPNWEENLALGLKLQVQLESIAPGITRPVCLRAQRFNQDMSAGALLVEVGAAGNTHPEAIRAAEILAQAIVSLALGALPEEPGMA